jgi:hypothetical protein
MSIKQELSKMGVQLSTRSANPNINISGETTQSIYQPSKPIYHPIIDHRFAQSHGLDHLIDLPPLDHFDSSDLQISPELMEAFSFLEPIDPSMGTL